MVQKEGQAALEEPQGSPNPAGVPGAPLEPPGATAGPVPGGEETDTETETALGSRRFLCGVVEGESFQRGSPPGDGVRGNGGSGIRGDRLVPAGFTSPSPPPPGGARSAGRWRAALGRDSARVGRSRSSRAGLLPLGLVLERGAPFDGSCAAGRGQAWHPARP